jgi:hypothetical protein
MPLLDNWSKVVMMKLIRLVCTTSQTGCSSFSPVLILCGSEALLLLKCDQILPQQYSNTSFSPYFLRIHD